jgi:soluble lytic murein transglycosylase
MPYSLRPLESGRALTPALARFVIARIALRAARRSKTGTRIRRWLSLAVLLLAAVRGADAGPASSPPPTLALEAAAKRVASGDFPAATEMLLTLDAENLPSDLRTQADLLLGIALLRQTRLEEAAMRLEAARAHRLLADYALYHLAQARRQAGRPDLAAEALGRLVDQHPQSLFLDRAAREIPRDFLEAGQLAQAEDAAHKYLAAVPSNPGRAEVRLTLGEVLLRAGGTAQAEDVLRGVWLDLPASPESQRAQYLLTAIPTSRPFTVDEQFQRAVTLHRLEQHAMAIPELAPFAVTGSPREAQARLMLGISAFHVRRYNLAAQWLEPLRDALGPERVEALFWSGRSVGRTGDAGKFTEYLTRVADSDPQSRRSEEALYLLAQSAADDADPVKSRVYLSRLLQDHPNGARADVAVWLHGWLAYKQRDFPAAAASWRRLSAEESRSRWRIQALYWRGRALEAMKKRAEAIQTYRTLLATTVDHHYYRLQAGTRLAVLTKRKAVPQRGAANVEPLAAGDGQGLHAQKARALRALGLTAEATEEWSEQVRSHPADLVGLEEACNVFLDVGRYDKSAWLGTRILGPLFVQTKGKPPISGFWKCAYPLGHIELVRLYARHRAVDPYLVLALIRQESAFALHDTSPTGARGLMQLMPETADLTAHDHGLPPVVAGDLDAPDVNIQLGVYHLSDLLRDFGGNLTLSLAAYNAGRQPVLRWLERFGFADEVEFIEDIPFTETRTYVKLILANYERYTSLYAAPAAKGPAHAGEGPPPTAKRTGGGH